MGALSHHKKSSLLILILMTTFKFECNAQTEHAAVVEEAAKVTEIKSDLDQAESKDPKKLEIVKQLRRLNPDGSYTVGFEAEDGTFKFESRDVLGNVKGTYGYVDANGEIKRVSYTAQNGTGIRGPGGASPEETTAATTPRNNRNGFVSSATTRRPTSLAYLTSSTASPTRSSVIQPIPRKRLIVPYPSDKSQNNYYSAIKNYDTEQNPETTTVIYATSIPNGKSSYLIRPTQHPQSSIKTAEQIVRPEKLEIDHVSNVKITSNRETSTSKPVVEEVDEKEPERRPNRGNHLRRQLPQEHHTTPPREAEEQFETQQHIIYSQADNDEGGHIYGGANGVSRPIFTNPTTRIPAIVLAARHRATQLQNVINNSNNPSTTSTTQKTTTTEKVYNSPPNRHENSEDAYDPTTESSSESPQSYLQTAGPVVQIPPNREIQSAADEESLILRRRPISPYNSDNFRQEYPRQFRIPPPQRVSYRIPQGDRNGQYHKETSQNDQQYVDENVIIPPNLPPYRQAKRAQNGRQYVQQQELQENSYEQQPYQIPLQPNPYRLSQYQQQLPYNNFPDRPLTTRDFERLLQILVLRHQQQLQQPRFGSNFGYYGSPNPYDLGYQTPNSPYYGYQQIPRPPIYDPLYDLRNPYYRGAQAALRQFSNPEAAYQAAQNQLPEQASQFDTQQLIPRKKQFGPRYFGAQSAAQYTNNIESSQQDYLPSDVREDLLYRMLMLAIHGEGGAGGQQLQSPSTQEETISPSASMTSTSRRDSQSPYSRKPVRSVQIIGEDS